MQQQLHATNPRAALVSLRILWGAMVMGLVLLGVVLALTQNTLSQTDGPGQVRATYTVVAYAMLVLMVPVGYFVRNQVYKSGWREHAVTPQAYFTGNLILFAVFEGLALAGFLLSALVGFDPVVLIPGAIGFGLLLLNFPTGKPMQPHEPRFGQSEL